MDIFQFNSNCEIDRTLENWAINSNCSLICRILMEKKFVCIVYTNFAEYIKYSNLKYNGSLTETCLPACNSISYSVQLSTQNYLYFEDYDIVEFQIGITHQRYLIYRRSELYTLNGFISNCGGILSLFMGISIMSIVEIVYSGTLRAFCNWRKLKSSIDTAGLSNQTDIEENTQESPKHVWEC